ncbi:hypothetical protein [Yoonia algicola]|uniref:Uncharacterized protein n=1 Tax=Yoonia algicola TaxID=3137368 RepID=A0AAN0NII0_9RHOB
MKDGQEAVGAMLRQADMATLQRRPISDEAKRAVAELSQKTTDFLHATGKRQRKHKAEVKLRFEATLGALTADLLLARLNSEADGYCWRKITSEDFKNTVGERRHFESIRDAWIEMKLIDIHGGFRGADDWVGKKYYPDVPSYRWATRLRATDTLIEYIESYGITAESLDRHFQRELTKGKPIIVKTDKHGDDKGRETAKFKRTAGQIARETEVNEINEYLAEQTFSFGPAPYLRRIYNNGDDPLFDWNHGGRLYAEGKSYLNWEADERKNIEINGSGVVEIDISACQLTIIHGLLGKEFDPIQDLYDFDGLERKDVKQVINTIIGIGGNIDHASGEYLSQKRKRILEAIKESFPILDQLGEKGLNSVTLQAIESDIMMMTLLRLKRDQQIPALPVHDCIIVRAEDADAAKTVFSDSFRELTGVESKLVTKG